MLCLITAVQPRDSVIHSLLYTFYIHSLFYILFYYALSEDTEYNSLCYRVGSCCLPILYIQAYIC